MSAEGSDTLKEPELIISKEQLMLWLAQQDVCSNSEDVQCQAAFRGILKEHQKAHLDLNDEETIKDAKKAKDEKGK